MSNVISIISDFELSRENVKYCSFEETIERDLFYLLSLEKYLFILQIEHFESTIIDEIGENVFPHNAGLVIEPFTIEGYSII